MNIFKFAFLFVLTAPFVGLVLLYYETFDCQLIESESNSVVPLIYYSLFLFGVVIAVIQVKVQSIDDSLEMKSRFQSESILLIFLCFITTIVLFFYGGLDVFLGNLTKEDIRQSGFLHAILTKYLGPSIFAYLSAKYRIHSLSRVQWLLSFLMTFVLGLATGGKASGLIAVLPGIAIVTYGKINLLKMFILGFISFVLLIAGAWLFDPFLERDIGLIVAYLIHRAFVLTAEVPFQVSIAYESNETSIEYYYTLLEFFGKSVLSYLGLSQNIEKYLFSLAVTAWLYPNEIDKIANGMWNLTPNVFVESLIIGGIFMLPLFGWVVAYVGFSIWNIAIKNFNKGNYASAAITSTYAVMVYLSWANSAGIMQLVHPLAIVSLTLSWLFLIVLSRISIRLQNHR